MRVGAAVALATAAAPAAAVGRGPLRDLSSYTHEEYAREFGKAYGDDGERRARAHVFAGNVALIQRHNAEPGRSWWADVNEFTDWSNDEFRARRTGIRGPLHTRAPRAQPQRLDDLPVSVDWRSKAGVVTKVKNQGSCGSCWAFSAVQTFESHLAIATGEDAPLLSEQQVVGCSPNPDHCGGTGGCLGSTQPLAFNYTETDGITLESDYPYKGFLGGGCHPEKIKPVARNSGYATLTPNNYTELAAAVATVGPVAISIAAGGVGWQLYGGGILNKCGFVVDHGVQLVGYGVDGDKGYWVVRNSWGPLWGEKGYIRIARFGEGKEPCGTDKTPGQGIACAGDKAPKQYCGLCAILSGSSYPTGVQKI